MEFKISEIYRIFGKKFKGEDRKTNKITVDSRTVNKNDVFFAIRGEKRDGHDFIDDAVKNGACLIICERISKIRKQVNFIKVKNTKDAILKLAKNYLKKFKKLKKIAITGSNGKTTTKELIAKILASKYRVLKSEKSYNNYLGLSLTIFNLKKKHDIAVFEFGMNHKGEIKKMVKDLELDVALITNIGNAHIGFFNDKKEIAQAKSEIFYGLKNNGFTVLNKDDEYFDFLRKKSKSSKLFTFGKNKESDIRFERGHYLNKIMQFKIYYKNKFYEIKTSLKGEHNIYNIASAFIVGLIFKVKVELIKKAIKNFKMKDFLRFEEKCINGINVINDAYNANIDSYRVAVETLKVINKKDLYVVAADMLELGDKVKEMHEQLGKMLANLNLKGLFLYGENAKYVKDGFLKGCILKDNCPIKIINDKKKLAETLKKTVKKGDTIFLKGSRLNKLEEIEKYLKQR